MEYNITSEEKKAFVKKMDDMSFMPKETKQLLTLLKEGFAVSDIAKSLNIYDITEHEQQIQATNEISNVHKFRKILERLNQGIVNIQL